MKVKDLFFFTTGERRGVCVLLALIAVLTAVRVGLVRAAPPAKASPVAAKTSYKKYVAPQLHIELNTADTLLLTELRGIGPGYARRIVQFRSRLGGFYRKEQLLDVYGFTDELYGKIADQVWVDASKVVPLQVNELGIAQLKRHPYIGYYQAKAIYDARMAQPNHRLRGWEEILSPDIDADFRERMAAYVSFE